MKDLSSGLVVKTLPSSAGSAGLILVGKLSAPRASWPKIQYVKQKQYCNKFNKEFNYGPHKKKS